MIKRRFRQFLPHIVAVLIFLVVAALYCKPVFENKVLFQEDVVQWQAMAHNSFQYKDTHGKFPLWTNGMFSGMPAYQIAMGEPGLDICGLIYNILTLWLMKPVSFFFLACICFYFLTGVLRINPYIGIIGGLAYAYATYNPIIIAAGHDTKMQAVAIFPAFMASLILIYEKKYWPGIACTTLFTALMVSTGHMQIVYYGVIVAIVMTLGYCAWWILRKDYRHLRRSLLIALAGGLVGVLCNAVVIFTSYDSSKESVRGGSELADSRSNYTSSGLNENTAFGYSLFKREFFVLLVPQIFGGGTEEGLPQETSGARNALEQMPAPLASEMTDGLRVYWGGVNESLSGPPYAGAIIVFLALLGCFILDNKHKWWILTAGVLTVAMSWGGYFKFFNSWLLKVLPMYNKFRAPSMIMIMPIFLLCLLAALSLQKMLTADRGFLWANFKKALFSLLGIFGVLLLFYMSFDYTSTGDQQLLQQAGTRGLQVLHHVQAFIEGLKTDRQNLFFGSFIRSFLFILASALLIGLYIKKKLRPAWFLGMLGAMALVDVMGVDIHYLNYDNYQAQKEYQKNFDATDADRRILQDKGYYRVFDLRDSVSNALSYGAMPAYFHHSIGGYHAAKLKIYEDLIDHQLYNYPNCGPTIDMLNTKYIIQPGANGGADSVITNRNAPGAAWFVPHLRFEPTPQAVMDSLTRFHPKKEAILFDTDRQLASVDPDPDTTATIRLLKNDNDVIIYRSESRTKQFAVFSEVFYKRGWKACIDNFNREEPIIRTNYALRGMSIPAGRHIIYFVFQPASYYLGRQIQWMANIILALMIIGAVIVTLQEKHKLDFSMQGLSSWYNLFSSPTR